MTGDNQHVFTFNKAHSEKAEVKRTILCFLVGNPKVLVTFHFISFYILHLYFRSKVTEVSHGKTYIKSVWFYGIKL